MSPRATRRVDESTREQLEAEADLWRPVVGVNRAQERAETQRIDAGGALIHDRGFSAAP